MAFTAFRGMKPWPQFIMACFIVLVTFLALLLVSIFVAIPVFGMNSFFDALSGGDLENPQTIVVLKYLQVMQSLGLFVLPPLIIAWVFEGNIAQYLQLNRKIPTGAYVLAVLALLSFSPFVTLIGQLNGEMKLPSFLAGVEEWMRKMEDQATVVIDHFMNVKTTGGLLFNLFMIAVIPAVGEEFLFRGVLQKIFTKMSGSYHWGIWISAFIFSGLHMQFFGFFPRLLLGALFGYILVYSGSLWLPILCHFVNNGLGVLSLFARNQGHEEVEKIANFEFGDAFIYIWALAILSLGLTYLLLRALKKAVGLEEAFGE